MKRLMILGLVWAAFPFSASAESFFCATEVSGGLKYVNGSWRGVGFAPGGDQFTVTQIDGSLEYDVKIMGSDKTLMRCKRTLYEGSPSSQMTCGGLGIGLVINIEDLRFTQVHTWGYIEDDRSGDNTPYVSGGKCMEIK